MPTLNANARKPIDVDGHTVNKNTPMSHRTAESRPVAWVENFKLIHPKLTLVIVERRWYYVLN